MGATNCPETPRQKMIGMMYLFLTAMLALNVSKDILNAFVVVNEGMLKTNTNFTLRNGFTYDAFTNAKQNDPIKVTPYYDAAMNTKKFASEMDAYIKDLKLQLIIKTDGSTKEEAEKKEEDMSLFDAKDNRDVPHSLLVGEAEDGSKGEARKLKEKLIEYKKNLFALLNDPKITFADKATTIKGLGQLGINTDNKANPNVDKPDEKYWETELFAEIPAAATLTMLSQIQNQVKNAEATVIQTLLGGIGATDFKFDTVAPRVIPKTNYLISGDAYEADLFIAAFSSSDTASKVLIGEGYDSINGKLTGNVQTLPVKRGIGKYVIDGAGVGTHTYSAIINVFNSSTGQFKPYAVKSGGKYQIEYTVAPPMAVVSPTKMNVLYIGVENPMEISVPGFRDDQISANCSGGQLYKSGKGWVCKVTKTGKCNISVSVKDDKGGSRSMGSKEFRMKRIPDPVPTVNKQKGGAISKGLLQAQQGVEATLEGFDFDLKFTIASFTVSATLDGGFQEEAVSPNNRFTPQQVALFGKLKKGKKVYIENVKCRKPDGTVVPLGSISFKIN
jgi:gliding motility-associated protein GldM